MSDLRPVPGYIDLFAHSSGSIWQMIDEELIELPIDTAHEYLKVRLHAPNPKVLTPTYILVCKAFHGLKPVGKTRVCHKDDDIFNNAASNLYWGTAQDNSNDMKRNAHSYEERRKKRCERLKRKYELFINRDMAWYEIEALFKKYGIKKIL
jgi:hypothetical protein